MSDRHPPDEAERSAEVAGRFQLLVDSVKDYGIFMLDRAGNVLTWSEGARGIKGYRADEIIGKNFATFYPAADVAAGRPMSLLARAAAEGRVEDEGWRVRRDGTRFWADVVISAVRNARGDLLGFVKVVRDLSDRRKLEREAVRRARQQEAIARLGLLALERRDLGVVMTRAVEVVVETLGIDVAEVMELLPGPARFALRSATGWDTASGTPSTIAAGPETLAGYTLVAGGPVIVPDMESETRFAGARLYHDRGVTSAVSALIHTPGQGDPPYGVFSAMARKPYQFESEDALFVQSIANLLATAIARRRAEIQLAAAEHEARIERTRTMQAQRALRERDEFISVAAHELRTPLTALQLKLEGLDRMVKDDGKDPAKVGRRLEGALRQTDRLGDLVERLLDVSRIVAGRLELRYEELDLSALVRQLAEDLREQALGAGSELRVAAGAPVLGRWDRARLEQVLLNIMTNAIKYGGGKPVDVVVIPGQERAAVEVIDRGIGISESDVDRIFGRFERAVPVRHYGGLGLGLYIARRIVEAHGGAIRVSGTKGEGSRFLIELPRQPSAGRSREDGDGEESRP